jgi:type VI secretion system protein ImpF
MRETRHTGGARALLFERLVDLDPSVNEESQPFRVLSKTELWESVSRELGRLLNTRCPVPLRLIGEVERTVINYGVPDFTSLSPQNSADRQLIATTIGQTIAAFEPRLRNVRVTAGRFEETERRLQLDWRLVSAASQSAGRFENTEHSLQIIVEAELVTDTVIEMRSYPHDSSSSEPVTFPIILHTKTGIIEL